MAATDGGASDHKHRTWPAPWMGGLGNFPHFDFARLVSLSPSTTHVDFCIFVRSIPPSKAELVTARGEAHERREANGRPMTSAALQAVKGYTTRRLTNGSGAAIGFTPAASNRGREANTKRVSGLTTDKPQSRQLRPVRQP